VAKGHDFPNVVTVGVMNADASLYLDDYRAAERTFSMLTQVAGRGGRADKRAVAVIQTMNPESPVIAMAAAQDYESFYKSEIALREALVFPPFCDFAVITVSGTDEAKLGMVTVRLSEYIREALTGDFSDVQTVVYGPFEAPVYKVNGSCRMRIVIKCRLVKRTRELLRDILCRFGGKTGRNVRVSIDLNPASM
jgi:primosomal protein N' (replication factor Y)